LNLSDIWIQKGEKEGDIVMAKKGSQFIIDWNTVPVIVDLAFVHMLTGYSTEYLRRKSKLGLFPAYKMFHGHWRVNRDDLKEWIEKQN